MLNTNTFTARNRATSFTRTFYLMHASKRYPLEIATAG